MPRLRVACCQLDVVVGDLDGNVARVLAAYQQADAAGADVAVFATARKLATLVYRLLRWGQAYVDQGAEAYERRYQERRINGLKSTAQQLGYGLTLKTSPAMKP